MKLSDICSVIVDAKIEKDGEFNTLGLPTIEYDNNDETLGFLESPDFIDGYLNNNSMQCVICTDQVHNIISESFAGGIILSESPRNSFYQLHNYLARETDFYAIHNCTIPTVISSSAVVHPLAIIDSHNVVIGDGSSIEAGVIIKSGTRIGNDVLIRSGTILGNPGFYYYGEDNLSVDSAGGILIKDNVELHSHCIIEKGVFGKDTIIGNHAKLDNQTFLGHDVIIGDRCIIAGDAMLAGFVEVGAKSYIGVGVTVSPFTKIGSHCKLSSGAVVTKDVEDNKHYSGNFAVEHNKYLKFIRSIR